jgi:type VI secretion system secreted protein Hcp
MSITSSFRAYVLAGLAALMLLLVVPLSAHAATDTFLKFDKSPTAPGLDGESTDASFPKAIEISEFDWGIENPTTIGSATGGAGTGKAKFEEVHIKKTPDASSAGLMTALGRSTPIPNAWIIVRKAGDGQTGARPYLQYRLNKVFVTKIDVSNSSGDDTPTENVTFAVGAVQQSYLKQGTTTPMVTGWDQVMNTPISGDFTAPVF